MKTFKLSLILLLMLGAFSCKKDSTSSSTAVTTDQAADIAASSLAENSGGLATVTDNITINAQTINSVNAGKLTINSAGQAISSVQECGTTLTDSATTAITVDSVTINYFFKYNHTLNCNTNNQPDNIINTLTYNGNFSGPRLTSTNSGTATVTISGLEETIANFTVGGEYKRTGSYQSLIGNKASGNSNIDIVVANLALDKTTRKILSGNGTISITGTGPRGTNFSFTGTVLFNGDETATLTINSTVYTVNLISGYRLRRL